MADLKETQVEELKGMLTKNIITEMESQGLSQAEVGRMIGMDRKNVNKTLRGKERSISLNQLVRIANGIGLTIKMIIKK